MPAGGRNQKAKHIVRGGGPFPAVPGRCQAEEGHPEGTGLAAPCYSCLVDGVMACRQERMDGSLLLGLIVCSLHLPFTPGRRLCK